MFSACFIWFLHKKMRYQKCLKSKIPSFVWRIWKCKEKKDKNVLIFRSRDLNPGFSKIPNHDLNYWRWWNQIQARTLKFLNFTTKFSLRMYSWGLYNQYFLVCLYKESKRKKFPCKMQDQANKTILHKLQAKQ